MSIMKFSITSRQTRLERAAEAAKKERAEQALRNLHFEQMMMPGLGSGPILPVWMSRFFRDLARWLLRRHEDDEPLTLGTKGALSTVPNVRANTVLTLKAHSHVTHPALEKTTLHVEQILSKFAADIAPGASACADFENDAIEIGITQTGSSPAELHRQLATIIGTLERHNALEIRGDRHNQLALTSSATQLAQPRSVAA